jgi:hypothetical protein
LPSEKRWERKQGRMRSQMDSFRPVKSRQARSERKEPRIYADQHGLSLRIRVDPPYPRKSAVSFVPLALI